MIDLASIKDVLLSVHYSDSKWTAAGIQQTTYVYLVPHTIFGWGCGGVLQMTLRREIPKRLTSPQKA